MGISVGKALRKLGKVGLGGVAGIAANKGRLPIMGGMGMLQRMGERGEDRGDMRPGMDMGADRGMMRPRMEMDAKKKGGKVKAKKMAAGGSTASKRADGCATKGKTKGRFV
jgi:hypothetical protein